MEPDSPKADPGKGAVLAVMNANEIQNAVKQALTAVPFVTGVNNHMGSKITARRSLMRPILDVIKSQDLYYIDSRTQSNTVAYKMARDMGMPAAKRDVFLDSEQTYEFAVQQIYEAKEVADRTGSAIIIGHPYPTSLRALADEMPKLDVQGYRFVFASKLLKVPGEPLP